jgi:hypothetical protein
MGGPKQKKAVFKEPPPTPKIPRNLNSGNLNFMDVEDEEIARQLTLIDYEYFAAIKPTELLNQAWNKPSLQSRCPNVMAAIERFNIVSKWVVSMIIKVENLRTRAKMFAKCLAISKHLSKLNNYNGMMAFVAAFNNAAVARLSQTRKEVPSKLLEDFELIEKIMNPESSWKSYRGRIHGADPPLIPYMGLYLSDLTFIGIVI